MQDMQKHDPPQNPQPVIAKLRWYLLAAFLMMRLVFVVIGNDILVDALSIIPLGLAIWGFFSNRSWRRAQDVIDVYKGKNAG